MMMRLWLPLVVLIGLGGCTTKTETGYEPRKLGDSETVQRAYYASPFSPAARQAASEAESGSSYRRPTAWRP